MNAQTILNNIPMVLNYLAIVIGTVAFLMAMLPQGKPGSTWDKIRTIINYAAMNWGHARNVVEKLNEAEKSND